MNDESIDCIDFVTEITAYLDDAVGSVRRSLIDAHLRRCPECTAALAQFRRTIEIAGHLAQADVAALDEATRSRLLRAFRDRPVI